MNFIEPYLNINELPTNEEGEKVNNVEDLTFENILFTPLMQPPKKQQSNTTVPLQHSETSNVLNKNSITPPINNKKYHNSQNRISSLESVIFKTLTNTDKEINKLINEKDDPYISAIEEALSNIEKKKLLPCVINILNIIESFIN